VWKQPRHRIFTWIDPDAQYGVVVNGRRGVSVWEAELKVQVVVEEPRPETGNEHGFANADADTFQQYKATSMDDIGGYRVVTRPSQTAAGAPQPWHIGLMESPYPRTDIPQWLGRGLDVASSLGEAFSVDLPPSTSYCYVLEPYTTQRAWNLTTDVYKIVTTEPQPISWTDNWPNLCWPEERPEYCNNWSD